MCPLNVFVLLLLVPAVWGDQIDTTMKITKTESSKYELATISWGKEDEIRSRISGSCESDDADCGSDDYSNKDPGTAEAQIEDCDNSIDVPSSHDSSIFEITNVDVMICFLIACIISLVIYITCGNMFGPDLQLYDDEIPSDPESVSDSVEEEPLPEVAPSMLQSTNAGPPPYTYELEMDAVVDELVLKSENLNEST